MSRSELLRTLRNEFQHTENLRKKLKKQAKIKEDLTALKKGQEDLKSGQRIIVKDSKKSEAKILKGQDDLKKGQKAIYEEEKTLVIQRPFVDGPDLPAHLQGS